MKYLITLGYDGTAYYGWQRQKNLTTVQEKVEEAVFKFSGQKAAVIASGRTDAGVHAIGQAAHFEIDKQFSEKTVMCALNFYLPEDIRITSAEIVGEDFHARVSVKKKTYMYLLYKSDCDIAVLKNRAVKLSCEADVEAMCSAAKLFEGERDFASYMCSGSPVKTTVRNVMEVKVTEDYPFIKIFVSANGFLYNMVRLIVSSLIGVSLKTITLRDIEDRLNNPLYSGKKEVAPACGLYLYQVEY